MAHDPPLLLLGAFDRHNFGDLLFAHIAAALLPGRRLIHAGLAARDLRPQGGHPTRALAQLADELYNQPLHLLHVGGELLTCDAWQAAVMVQTPEQAPQIIARYDPDPAQRRAWAARTLGLGDQAPYCAAREMFPQAHRVFYCAVGGVELGERPAAMRDEVLGKLRGADGVGVRDRVTQTHLAAAGIDTLLMPDPAVMVAELCGAAVHRHARHGEVAQVRSAFPHGYLAVQLSADFGDDETLHGIAGQLDQIARDSGLALVLFRAGAAPWHDDLACYRRLAAQLHAPAVWLFSSLHLWDICALIAHSRGYCGSSLHGRIVATACGLPRLTVRHPAHAGRTTKQEAYGATWEIPAMASVADIADIAATFAQALQVDTQSLQNHAAELAHRYRQTFDTLVVSQL